MKRTHLSFRWRITDIITRRLPKMAATIMKIMSDAFRTRKNVSVHGSMSVWMAVTFNRYGIDNVVNSKDVDEPLPPPDAIVDVVATTSDTDAAVVAVSRPP